MFYWAIFLFEFIILFLTCRQLSSSLFLLFYKIFRSHKIALHMLSIIFLPGVIVHELAHFLVAELLRVKTGEIEFVPVLHGNSVKLGSVQIAQTDFIRRFLIGVAPFLAGSGLLFLIAWYASAAFSFQSFFNSAQSIFKYALIVYGLFVISNTMFSSAKDLEGAAVFILIAVVLGLAIFLFSAEIVVSSMQILQAPQITTTVHLLSFLLVIPVVANLFFLVGLKMVAKR